MDQGLPSAACALCYQEESHGYQSERVRAILQLDDENFSAFTSKINLQHHEVGVNLGNLCPLACRSCQSSESSTWSKITKIPQPNSCRSDILTDSVLFEWIKHRLRWVHENYANPTVHLIGGEPLVQTGLYVILDWLIEQELAQDFTVAMTTSLSVNLTEKLRQRLAQFHHVGLSLSIDSVGHNFHYVRWPSQFHKIEQNLQLLRSWTDQIPRLTLSLNPVFSISNVFYIDQYLDYWQHHDMPIWPLHLWSPDHLAVENIAPQYQPTLLQYLDTVKQHCYFEQHSADTLIQQIQSFCDSQLASTDDIFCRSMAWMADYDKRTGLTMAQYNGRLWDLLTEKHRDIYLDQFKRANIMISIDESVSHACE